MDDDAKQCARLPALAFSSTPNTSTPPLVDDEINYSFFLVCTTASLNAGCTSPTRPVARLFTLGWARGTCRGQL